MRNKIFILSSLIATFGVAPAFASECVGDGCDIETPVIVEDCNCEFTMDEECSCGIALGPICPFDTELECEIWQKKPMMNESVNPHSPRLDNIVMANIIDAIGCDSEISANDDTMMPLARRYKLLQQSANICCKNGFLHKIQKNGASDDMSYKFLVDDANFYGFGARCLMMDDNEIGNIFSHRQDIVFASDTRNECLCQNRDWYRALLRPFETLYNLSPEFAASAFYYTYTDGLGREIKISVNEDVQNVLSQLNACP